MILIDNYDSFTYNIVEYLKELGAEPAVFKNDEITVEQLKETDFDSIIISPGPGNPQDKSWFGVCDDVIETFYKSKKILGICLGHQLIASHFGARVIKDDNPFHGKVSSIRTVCDDALFKSLPCCFDVTRYHSLKVEGICEPLIPLAYTDNNILMALKHRDFPVYGVQFHPEAILTQYGHELLENFLRIPA